MVRIKQIPASPEQWSSLSPLRMLILSDLHLPTAPHRQRRLLENRALLSDHGLVILLGDMTRCYGTPGEYQAVREFIAELDRPYVATNGNHEFAFYPYADETADYATKWTPASPEVRREQLRRFERFYGIESRFQHFHHPSAEICVLGLDDIGQNDVCLFDNDHEEWFFRVLEQVRDRPLLVFCHVPVADPQLRELRYYEPGRHPFYTPSHGVRQLLRQRRFPTFWFSGHLHLQPQHPLGTGYRTPDNIWQIHCPDFAGYGRADNENWYPSAYPELFVNSLLLGRHELVVETLDLGRGGVPHAVQNFGLSASERMPKGGGPLVLQLPGRLPKRPTVPAQR